MHVMRIIAKFCHKTQTLAIIFNELLFTGYYVCLKVFNVNRFMSSFALSSVNGAFVIFGAFK